MRDTGSGMPPDIASRVMEPFFTTKEEGQGTGLGLSMVYGFVKQSGGTVRIHSEVGEGTTVRLYFPASSEYADDVQAVKQRVIGQGGSENILIVEDKPDVAVVAKLFWKVPATVSCAHPADAKQLQCWSCIRRWMRCSPI